MDTTFFGSLSVGHMLISSIILFFIFWIGKQYMLYVHTRKLRSYKTLLQKVYYAETKLRKRSPFIAKAFEQEIRNLYAHPWEDVPFKKHKDKWSINKMFFVAQSRIVAKT